MTTRPKDDALVTSLPAMLQMYGAWVCALITTLTRGSSPWAIDVISGPLKLTHLFDVRVGVRVRGCRVDRHGRRVLEAALMEEDDERLDALLVAELVDQRVDGRRPPAGTRGPQRPTGVTIVGVPSSVRPMNAIFALSIFSTSYAGRIVVSVPS